MDEAENSVESTPSPVPEISADQPQHISPLLVFVNPGSGAGLGAQIIESVSGLPGVTVVPMDSSLPSSVEERRAWAAERAIFREDNLSVVICGGDGSVNWIVSLLIDALEPEHRPPMAVIPLGTGNDMSNALGWGQSVTAGDLTKEMLTQRFRDIRSSAVVRDLDLWTVVLRLPGTEAAWSTRLMLNYFSIGTDARIARDFESCRRGCCGCCFCCHCITKLCYGPVGALALFGVPALRDYVDASLTLTDGSSADIDFGRFDRALVFQNIPSIYGGRNLWRGARQDVEDGLLECCIQGGAVSLGLFQLGFPTGKSLCQCSSVKLDIDGPSIIQVDGEAVELEFPMQVNVDFCGSYKMIFKR